MIVRRSSITTTDSPFSKSSSVQKVDRYLLVLLMLNEEEAFFVKQKEKDEADEVFFEFIQMLGVPLKSVIGCN